MLVEGNLSNIPVKFQWNWNMGLGRVGVKDFSIFSSDSHLVYQSGTILAILVGSHIRNIPVKFESHWPKGLGGESI